MKHAGINLASKARKEREKQSISAGIGNHTELILVDFDNTLAHTTIPFARSVYKMIYSEFNYLLGPKELIAAHRKFNGDIDCLSKSLLSCLPKHFQQVLKPSELSHLIADHFVNNYIKRGKVRAIESALTLLTKAKDLFPHIKVEIASGNMPSIIEASLQQMIRDQPSLQKVFSPLQIHSVTDYRTVCDANSSMPKLDLYNEIKRQHVSKGGDPEGILVLEDKGKPSAYAGLTTIESSLLDFFPLNASAEYAKVRDWTEIPFRYSRDNVNLAEVAFTRNPSR